ncbi:MAG: PQQ-binding-like beta-propeller repeat protein [Rubripirellula sp.]
MLANELIDRLERLGLLDQEIIEALREQLEQGGTRVTPEAVAKLLVDNGQLTHFQATKLIGELRSGEYEEASTSAEESDLTAGLDDLSGVTEAEVEVVEAVDVFEAEPVAVEAVAVEAVPVSAEMMEDAPTDRPRPTRKKAEPPPTVWDSFKVYGYLGIIALLVLMGLGIWFVLSRENADDFIAEANKLYDQQNYDAAQDMYLTFLDSFGEDNQYASVARTRVTMTELYKAAGFKQEPWRAVDLAKEKLPEIAEEEGMNEERGNLAALLVDIAANLASSASRAKDTPKKQELLAKLDEQRELMENPLYMPTAMKTTLSGQIQGVEEARARVQRDINRNIRLDESETSMIASLDKKKTKDAYDTRKQLLREFPELHDHERLVTLIMSASDIQQTLVGPSAELPKAVTESSATDELKSILLTTLAGGTAPDLRGETLYFRAGGSILAFDGENGKLRWRKFVGYAKDLPPVRLEGGVLLSESASLEVLRCGEQDGSVVWRSLIDEQFSLPIYAGDEVYVATESGRLISMDADSGDAKWATQIPQPLETGPGVDDRANRMYVPGNHSNLYLLNTRDGKCLESYYIGHDEGTVSVPPIPLLGHVFVIENAGSDYANVHVLRVDETGENLQTAQMFRLTGNVRVPPIIQGRRLIVLTDRGEVVVYDVEPTAEREQVTEAAKLPAFYEQPTATQMAVGRSQMWITGTRIGRYELQINTGRVIRDWGIHELDTFIGQPYATEDTLVHARVLRGTSAIRVTAADPKTGEEIWRTDVGVPVAMLKPAPGGNGLHCVTTQAALFELDREALGAGSTTGPIENPGENAVAIRFENPIAINETSSLMLNQVDGQSIIVYEPQRANGKLRQLTMNLSAGKPVGGGVVSGGGLFLPLDTGRAVLIDWRTGANMGTPFQPASDPVKNVQWTNPITLPDDPDQVVLADSRKKLYRLRVGEQIRELASRDLEYELLGTIAGVGDTLVGTTAGPSADFIVGMEMVSLDEKFKTLLNGRVVWGPVSAGELCLFKTDDSKLRGIDADGAQLFEVDIPKGSPIGQPIVVDDTIVLVGKTGWLLAINATSGEVTGQTDLGQPISGTPLVAGTRLLVPGTEGVVYLTEIPRN